MDISVQIEYTLNICAVRGFIPAARRRDRNNLPSTFHSSKVEEGYLVEKYFALILKHPIGEAEEEK